MAIDKFVLCQHIKAPTMALECFYIKPQCPKQFETNHIVQYELIRQLSPHRLSDEGSVELPKVTSYDDLRLLSQSVPLYQQYDLNVFNTTKLLCEN